MEVKRIRIKEELDKFNSTRKKKLTMGKLAWRAVADGRFRYEEAAQVYLSRWQDGVELESCRVTHLAKLATVLGVQIQDLIEFKLPKTKKK